ncbi:hypothetical protein [Prosthecochloris sp. HL-130-GSB]|uniref:hypothetical protein n=1 Tax=Prosthecochloris sp. HL-130-GSB TaxID=1974213 RepID=UPI000A1C1130|nr:hypothetical protein [Prosthecochloris sp. HL-130-GSB]ARM31379.1 hypothetical protein B9H02_08845 [Prosthecochloris sp. HL-130-GSB]
MKKLLSILGIFIAVAAYTSALHAQSGNLSDPAASASVASTASNAGSALTGAFGPDTGTPDGGTPDGGTPTAVMAATEAMAETAETTTKNKKTGCPRIPPETATPFLTSPESLATRHSSLVTRHRSPRPSAQRRKYR